MGAAISSVKPCLDDGVCCWEVVATAQTAPERPNGRSFDETLCLVAGAAPGDLSRAFDDRFREGPPTG